MTISGTWNGNPITKENLQTHIEGFILKHQLDPSKLTLTTSAALVYYGSLDQAADIDFVVEPEYFEKILSLFPDVAYSRSFTIRNDKGEDENFQSYKLMVPYKDVRFELWSEYIEGQTSVSSTLPVRVATMPSVLYMKSRLGRPKDLVHMCKVLKNMR